MQDESLTPLQIQTALYIIKKHKWKIVALFLSTVITATVGSLMATPIYQVSSRLLVKPGREDVYISPTGDSPAVIDRSIEGEKVNAEVAILRSSALVAELVDSFGVNHLYEYPDRTLKGKLFKRDKQLKVLPIHQVHESVRASLDVSRVPKSNVIEVAFNWPDPVLAARALNKLVELYLVQHLKVHTNPQTYNLLEEQTKKGKAKLRESEKQLEDFKRLHSITSLPQQRTILLGKLSEAESQRKNTESEIQQTWEVVSSLKAHLANLDENVQLREAVNQDSATVAALKAKLIDVELQGLKEEISRLKEMIAEEEKKEQEARLRGLEAKLKNQKSQITAYQEELKTLDGFGKRMNELERAVAIDEANYKLYLTKFEEAKISESMDKQKIANVSVIEPAVPSMEPVKPKKRINVMIGGFLGLFTGISMAFLLELIRPVFRTREDVDHFLGLPVLATVPKERQNVAFAK